jgi:hypothetical protein
MEFFDSEKNNEFIDPISFEIMKDPIVLSSGQVFDRSSIYDAQGKMKVNRCPITRQPLEKKAYPLSYLKGKLTKYKLDRFNQLIDIANQYKGDQEKFNQVCERAELILKTIGEDVYKGEASKLAKLLLSSPFLTQPKDFANCYKRVYLTLPDEDKLAFAKDHIMSL